MCKDDSNELDRRKVDAADAESGSEVSADERRPARGVVVPLKQVRKADLSPDDPDGDDPGPAAA